MEFRHLTDSSENRLKKILDADMVQKVQDALAQVFDIGLLMKEADGEYVTKPSNLAYYRERTDGSHTDWDYEYDVEFTETLKGRISIIKGPKANAARFKEMCDFLTEAAKYMVHESKRAHELNRELTYARELERKLEQRNEHDMLTNLFNRYYYERKITELTIDDTAPVSIAVIDANLLKLSNDIFGHSEGDCLLQLISAALVEEKNPAYSCCRCGGDEFYVVMPGADRNEAENYMKRVVERTKNDYCTRIPPSFAYGIGTKTQKGEDLQETIKEAEDSMYLRKIDMKCDGKILEILRQCLMDTGHFNYDEAIATVNLNYDFCEYLGIDGEELRKVDLLMKLYPLGMLIIPVDVLQIAKSHVADALAGKYDYVGTEYRIAMMFEETAPVAHYVMQWNEKWDGTGKPAHLSGEDISKAVRILRITMHYMKYAVAPPFGYGSSRTDALDAVIAESGKTFDPALVESFKEFIADYKFKYEITDKQ